MDIGEASASNHLIHLRFSHGQGARCWTTDGREFIDLICGQGPIILGHAHPEITTAIERQLHKGTLLPGHGPAFYRLREMLLELYPHTEDMLTFKTGSEAVAAAIRLTRAHTGRDVVLRIGFHGWHDQVISPYVRCHNYDVPFFDTSWPIGVPHAAYDGLMRVWHGTDVQELVSLIRKTGHELAAILIDPVQLYPPNAAQAASALSKAAAEVGALLIFDESKTGFRVHLGGTQALYGVKADITILSKALANGSPLSAILGPASLLALAQPARVKGTFAGELTSIAAAVATVALLESMDAPSVLDRLGAQLITGINAAIIASGLGSHVEAVPYQWNCMPFIRFKGRAQGRQVAFINGLTDRGVLMLNEHMSYICMAMTPTDIQRVIVIVHETLNQVLYSLD